MSSRFPVNWLSLIIRVSRYGSFSNLGMGPASEGVYSCQVSHGQSVHLQNSISFLSTLTEIVVTDN